VPHSDTNRTHPHRAGGPRLQPAKPLPSDSAAVRTADRECPPWNTYAVIKELLVLLGAFFGATLLAELLGAVNTGTALTFGQLGLAAAFTWIVVSRP
jgi:hypothetical protein